MVITDDGANGITIGVDFVDAVTAKQFSWRGTLHCGHKMIKGLPVIREVPFQITVKACQVGDVRGLDAIMRMVKPQSRHSGMTYWCAN